MDKRLIRPGPGKDYRSHISEKQAAFVHRHAVEEESALEAQISGERHLPTRKYWHYALKLRDHWISEGICPRPIVWAAICGVSYSAFRSNILAMMSYGLVTRIGRGCYVPTDKVLEWDGGPVYDLYGQSDYDLRRGTNGREDRKDAPVQTDTGSDPRAPDSTSFGAGGPRTR